jgi:hypothetical protein
LESLLGEQEVQSAKTFGNLSRNLSRNLVGDDVSSLILSSAKKIRDSSRRLLQFMAPMRI